MKELNVQARVENLAAVNEFISGQLDEADCPMKVYMPIEIAVEELFTNICYYAYGDSIGSVRVQTEFESDPSAVIITFIDSGKPYDPLAKADPDITLGIEDRPIGGLGIFMVKKSMDDITYKNEDGCNILAIKKILA